MKTGDHVVVKSKSGRLVGSRVPTVVPGAGDLRLKPKGVVGDVVRRLEERRERAQRVAVLAEGDYRLAPFSASARKAMVVAKAKLKYAERRLFYARQMKLPFPSI